MKRILNGELSTARSKRVVLVTPEMQAQSIVGIQHFKLTALNVTDPSHVDSIDLAHRSVDVHSPSKLLCYRRRQMQT